jgi:hypothetical protein
LALSIVAEHEESRRRERGLDQGRGPFRLAPVGPDQGQHVGGVRVPLAAGDDGPEDLLSVDKALDPVIDGPQGRRSVDGVGVLPHARLGELQRPPLLGVVGLPGQDQRPLVARPGVAGRLLREGLEHRLDGGEILALTDRQALHPPDLGRFRVEPRRRVEVSTGLAAAALLQHPGGDGRPHLQ